MSEFVYPSLFVVFVWWFSTGLILYLDGFPGAASRWSMRGATVVALLALAGLYLTRADTTIAGAYISFLCGVLIWGWHEMSFLMGVVTGPVKKPCPAGRSGWRRFGLATLTLIYHEVAILLTAVIAIALTWGADNKMGTWAFLILWAMRLSTKLNIFLGVPNVTEQFLPDQLHYLKSYFSRKPMNMLFPFSVTLSTAVAVLMVASIVATTAQPVAAAGLTLLTVLLILGILEHWFLVVPLPVEALWRWGLRSHAENNETKGSSLRAVAPHNREPGIADRFSAPAGRRTRAWQTAEKLEAN